MNHVPCNFSKGVRVFHEIFKIYNIQIANGLGKYRVAESFKNDSEGFEWWSFSNDNSC